MKLRRARTGLSVYPGLTPLFFWSGKFSCRFLLRLSLHSCSLCPFSPLPLSHPPSLHTTLSNFRSHSRHFSQFQLARWGDRLPQYNLIKSDQIWSNLVKTIILIRFDQFWSDLIRFDQVWSVFFNFSNFPTAPAMPGIRNILGRLDCISEVRDSDQISWDFIPFLPFPK